MDDTWDSGDHPAPEPDSPDAEVAAKTREEAPARDRQLVERLQAGRAKALAYPLPDRVAVVAAVVVVILARGWLILHVSTTEPDPVPMTAGETLDAFFEARKSGDCERLVHLTSEASWSDGGARNREDFLEQCAEALEGSEPHTPDVYWQYVDTDGDGRVEDSDAENDQAAVSLAPQGNIGSLDHTGEMIYHLRGRGGASGGASGGSTRERRGPVEGRH